jgi:hypothetical protein
MAYHVVTVFASVACKIVSVNEESQVFQHNASFFDLVLVLVCSCVFLLSENWFHKGSETTGTSPLSRGLFQASY